MKIRVLRNLLTSAEKVFATQTEAMSVPFTLLASIGVEEIVSKPGVKSKEGK